MGQLNRVCYIIDAAYGRSVEYCFRATNEETTDEDGFANMFSDTVDSSSASWWSADRVIQLTSGWVVGCCVIEEVEEVIAIRNSG